MFDWSVLQLYILWISGNTAFICIFNFLPESLSSQKSLSALRNIGDGAEGKGGLLLQTKTGGIAPHFFPTYPYLALKWSPTWLWPDLL